MKKNIHTYKCKYSKFVWYIKYLLQEASYLGNLFLSKLLSFYQLSISNLIIILFLHYKRAISLEQSCQNQAEAAFYHKKQVTKSLQNLKSINMPT